MRTRCRQPDKIEKEVSLVELPVNNHKFVPIPELGIRVSIKEGDSLKRWVKAYCKNNPHLKPILYPIYT